MKYLAFLLFLVGTVCAEDSEVQLKMTRTNDTVYLHAVYPASPQPVVFLESTDLLHWQAAGYRGQYMPWPLERPLTKTNTFYLAVAGWEAPRLAKQLWVAQGISNYVVHTSSYSEITEQDESQIVYVRNARVERVTNTDGEEISNEWGTTIERIFDDWIRSPDDAFVMFDYGFPFSFQGRHGSWGVSDFQVLP